LHFSNQPISNPEARDIRFNAGVRESATVDHSPCEHHQCRIQSNWQEEMTGNDRTKWINCHKVCYPPEDRDKKGPSNHYSGTKNAKDKCALKAFQKLWHLLEKGGILDLFGSRTPCHIDSEEMAY
jgi:hypothetical protein